MNRLPPLWLHHCPGLGRVALGLVAAALVTLVVNRLPCMELEGFEGGAWPAEGWIAHATKGGTLQRSSAHSGTYGMTNVEWYYNPDVPLRVGSKVSAWVRADRDGAGRFYLGFNASSAGCKSLVVAFNTNDIRFHENPNYAYTELTREGVELTSSRWYLLELEIREGGLAVGRLYDSDAMGLLATVRHTYPSIGSSGLAMRAFGGISVDSISLCP